MSQKFKSEVELQALNNATTDTDKFLVSDSGVVKYRTGNEVLSDLGITLNTASKLQHKVKAGVAINKGQAVYVTSADGTNMIVGLASNASEATSSKTMGLLDATVAINGFANVVTEGLLAGLNTVGANAGDPVWLGTGGNLIYGLLNKPYAPAHLVFIGIVTRVNANNGEIFVKVQNGFELNEIHDVDLKTTTPVNGHVLGFDGTLWVNKTIAGWLGYTPANANGTTNYVSKFTSATTLGNSQIFDNGTNVGIGTTSPRRKLDVEAYTSFFSLSSSINSEATTNNQQIGGIDFRKHYSLAIGASIRQLQAGGTNNYSQAHLAFYTNNGDVSFGDVPPERMRITSAGNVGIGTTNPTGKLSILDGYYNTFFSDTSSQYGSGLILSGDAGGGVQKSWKTFAKNGNGAVALTFDVSTNGTSLSGSPTGLTYSEKMRITPDGNLGIGTTSPSEKLSVYGNAKIDSNNAASQLYFYNSGTALGSIGKGNYAVSGADFNGISMYSVGAMSFASGGQTERMRITSAGNVGIGTTSPSEKLEVNGTVKSNFPLGTLQLGKYSFGNGETFIEGGGDLTYSEMWFSTFGTERMRITSGGNVGIGTTSPGSKLDVNGSINVSSSGNIFTAATSGIFFNGNNSYATGLYNDGNNRIRIATNGSDKVWIESNGNVGIGTTSPNALLDVAGDALINGLTVGTGPGNDTSNTVFGENAFGSNSSAIRNVAIGASALSALTINGKNVAIGFGALGSTQETDYSIAIGYRSTGGVGGNVRGLTAIGVDMSYDPSQATELGNNCLAISQYDNTTPGLPHFYAPAKIVCPNGNTVTDVLSFDYTLYTAVFMDYSIYNDSGDQFRAGTYTIAMKISGSDVTNDDQTVVYSGTTLSATFIVSISGNIATIQIRNQDSDNYNFRFTSRLLMR